MKHEIRNHPTLGRVLFLTDGKTELAAALDCGIRLVHLSCVGMENLFYEQPADLSDGLTTEQGWRIYGGHRLWAAPECGDTYCPDNDPITAQLTEDGVLLTQAVAPWTGLQKTVAVRFAQDGTIALRHKLTNCGDKPVEAAAWAVSSMAAGGRAVVPLPRHMGENPSGPHRSFCLWNTTTYGDSRLTFSEECIALRQDAAVSDYFKMGLYSDLGQLEYENFGQRLTIRFTPHERDAYPDMGSNIELFANTRMQEVETLGVLATLQPGESTEHTELWQVTAL